MTCSICSSSSVTFHNPEVELCRLMEGGLRSLFHRLRCEWENPLHEGVWSKVQKPDSVATVMTPLASRATTTICQSSNDPIAVLIPV